MKFPQFEPPASQRFSLKRQLELLAEAWAPGQVQLQNAPGVDADIIHDPKDCPKRFHVQTTQNSHREQGLHIMRMQEALQRIPQNVVCQFEVARVETPN